ncbi:hypothetical protein BZG36_02079 [Bifiguratus adelaidae]|uniref:Uncharacterized protein n=1 Tax=Bifiguratus adelaidae TaxID=1938954 RepID=A0A261Y363_9FUNG|nr:hypothetical protein BZG36_02079 [Bifiguratus adelaidae]
MSIAEVAQCPQLPDSSQCKAFVLEYTSRCCDSSPELTSTLETKVDHVLVEHVQQVLVDEVGVYFREDARKRRFKDKKTMGEDPHEDREAWKQKIVASSGTWVPVDVFIWCAMGSKNADLNELLPKIISQLLSLLEDWQTTYQWLGALMVDFLVEKDSSLLHRKGIDGLLFEAMQPHLLRVMDKELWQFVAAMYSSEINLIQNCYTDDEAQRLTKYERLMHSIIEGLKYGGDVWAVKISILCALRKVVVGLGIVASKYLKIIIPVACETLDYPPIPTASTCSTSQLTLQFAALDVLDAILQQCWPLLPRYQGIILRSLTIAWRRSVVKANDPQLTHDQETFRGRLREFSSTFVELCGDAAKADVEAIVKLNSVFADLPVLGCLRLIATTTAENAPRKAVKSESSSSGTLGMIKSRRRLPWIAEEDKQLKDLQSKLGNAWTTIAQSMPGRNAASCHNRWHYLFDSNWAVGPWTPEEDKALKHLHSIYGDNYTVIHKVFPTPRKPFDLRERYVQTLNPNIKRGRWQEDELIRLEEAHRNYGEEWRKIAQAVGTRTAKQCLEKWKTGLHPFSKKGFWSSDEDRALLSIMSKIQHKDWHQASLLMHEQGFRRSSRACMQRFTYWLDPEIDRSRWTPEEDALLLQVGTKFGNRMRPVVNQLTKKRSVKQAWNRYYMLTKQPLFNFSSTLGASKEKA